ncbi:MAG TPA: alpha-glucan family phosphorylase [Steroidobacteraceae bacterium]|nr:alpha-glucan family phosphorylase [Steroidobacteraceae bacterium]
MPQALRGLDQLALDLRWSWNHGADQLWHRVDAQLWDATRNPWLILESVSETRLIELAGDGAFLAELREQLAAREQHLHGTPWFTRQHGDLHGQIAYFSMEFGLSEALPIYSGGLGVLAADHLKAACDLGVPVVGVSLLYQRGYFRQKIGAHGEQIELYPLNDPTMLPVTPLRDDSGAWVQVSLQLPGRQIHLRTWQVQVGRRSLLLLDSNHLLNDPADRGVTGELYGGGPELRLQQELVLGLGGWQLLEQLGIDCCVCHLNEGHAAFAVLARARQYLRAHQVDFDVALRATRAGNLFTTHTPVAAGFDRFEPELIEQYLADFAASVGLPVARLLALGRGNPQDAHEPFNMALLAARGCGAINGVSRLHGVVSRRIFQSAFPRWPEAEVPVDHVTNGVHTPTWDSPEADKLWTAACGKGRWRDTLEDVEGGLRGVEDEALWRFRCASRASLMQFLRGRCGREVFNPDVLTLGFARRMTGYKRTTLLLHDPERLLRLLASRDRPVQIVLAGKAHPRDEPGKQMLEQWLAFASRGDVDGRVVFVEDYDLAIAAELTRGVDLWVNTPLRPWEACGTSGMKVLVNGGLNVSVLDGWWAEAWQPELGWALGDGDEADDAAVRDARDADELYRLLESAVVPEFYARDAAGIPRAWVARMRESMARLTTQYSTNRMVREYVERYYVPLARACRQRVPEAARQLEQRYRQLAQHWPQLHFGNVAVAADAGRLRFTVQLYLGDLNPDFVQVEAYAEGRGEEAPVRHPLQRGAPLAGAANAFTYEGELATGRPAGDFTPRAMATDGDLLVPLEADFITWYR